MEDNEIKILKDYLKTGHILWWEGRDGLYSRITQIGHGPIIKNEEPEPSEVAYVDRNYYLALYNVPFEEIIVTKKI